MEPIAQQLLATALPLALLAVLAARVAYVVARRRPGVRSDSPRLAATRALLAAYAIGLCWWTIVLANPNQDGSRHANLVPFREIARSLTDREEGYGLLNFWGNIVAFIPVGVLGLLALRRGRRFAWLVAAAAGAGLSALLEACQYGVGRSADIDDVILNAAGVALGVALASMARRLSSRDRALRRRAREVRRISQLVHPAAPAETGAAQ